jgi:hypothetical protein
MMDLEKTQEIPENVLFTYYLYLKLVRATNKCEALQF